ncbi:glycosyltransferase family 2 protein [Aeromonas salmonicida]|uniref:glycosyltransferase family 2 protein n=1 Tax=Aeromonas salmonicida TaxID=645 RepID=UPI0038D3B7F4
MKRNFLAKLKSLRQASRLKNNIVSEGVKGNYQLVHGLIPEIGKNDLHTNEAVRSVLYSVAVVRVLNEARDYFHQQGESDKAYECFIYSLRLRNRQRENIDSEISRCIDKWQPEKILFLAEKGYDAYKHTRYLAIQALMHLYQQSEPFENLSETNKRLVNYYLQTGRLKGLYLFYLKEKLYHSHDSYGIIFIALIKGLKDPLLNSLIVNFLHQYYSKNRFLSTGYVGLYLATLVEGGRSSDDMLAVSYLFKVISSLPEGDEKALLIALKDANSGATLDEISKSFFKLKKASGRYCFIRLMSGVNKDNIVRHFAKNACAWKAPAFIAKLFKLLFDCQYYGLIIEIFHKLQEDNRQHPQVFIFYVSSLRNTGKYKQAKDLLKSAPSQIPALMILSQEYYLSKKEKDLSKALQIARRVYDLQSEKNKPRWAFSIVDLMCAEGDFESAYKYVTSHHKYAKELMPLIHFKEGTLTFIENEIISRLMAGEQCDDLYYYLSYLYCERKNYYRAIEYINKAVKLKVSRRNSLHYILLKSVVEKDYQACLSFIRNNQLDSDVLFAKYYAYSLIQLGAFVEADNYLSLREDVFNNTQRNAIERKLLLANSARLAGNHKISFELFSSIFPEDQRCFTCADNTNYSYAVMNLRSTASIIHDDLQPMISVIMTNYGWSNYTSVAIQSILDQTHSNFELIIVDDHSEKNAYRKLAKFIRGKKDKRIKIVRLKKNSGTYRAKNTGLSISRGKYITFQDSDDWSHPMRLQVQLGKLLSVNALALVVNCCRIDSGSLVSLHKRNLLREGPITLFYKRLVLDSLGYFDSVRTSADSEFISRIESYYGPDSICHIETPYYIASFHDRSLTSYGPLSLDPILGVVGARKEYSLKYKEWHKNSCNGDLYMDFPLNERKFPAPLQLSL